MTPAEKAKRTLTIVEIPRDELALRIAKVCTGIIPPPGMTATKALDTMDEAPTSFPLGASFRAAADEAVRYFHECVSAAVQPS